MIHWVDTFGGLGHMNILIPTSPCTEFRNYSIGCYAYFENFNGVITFKNNTGMFTSKIIAKFVFVSCQFHHFQLVDQHISFIRRHRRWNPTTVAWLGIIPYPMCKFDCAEFIESYETSLRRQITKETNSMPTTPTPTNMKRE